MLGQQVPLTEDSGKTLVPGKIDLKKGEHTERMLDNKMPKVSGLEILKHIKADEHLKAIDDDNIANQGVPGAGTGFLTKPCTPAMPTREVRHLLDP